jgi:hypothetical protein
MAASSAPTLLQPSRPHRAGHLLRHTPIDAAPPPSRSKLRHRLRSPDWATMRPSFTLRRFKESRERSQSAARGNGFPKSTGLFASPLHCVVRGGGRRGGDAPPRDGRDSTADKGSHASADRPPIEATHGRDEDSAATPRDPDQEWPLPAPRRCFSPLGPIEQAIHSDIRQSTRPRHHLHLKRDTG